METIRVGLIGLGCRGRDLLRTSLISLPQVNVTAVCDLYEDRVQSTLDYLKENDIRVTFFLVGDNVRKHPQEFQMILDRGHRVGNHTFNHIQGFKYLSYNYLANTNKADELIKSDLFRPPHGWMRWEQYMVLKHRYRIVMWDLVTRDYSNKLNGPQVFNIVKKYVRNGSIITFHDSIKSEQNLKYALPRSIEWLKEQGYEFKVFD